MAVEIKALRKVKKFTPDYAKSHMSESFLFYYNGNWEIGRVGILATDGNYTLWVDKIGYVTTNRTIYRIVYGL